MKSFFPLVAFVGVPLCLGRRTALAADSDALATRPTSSRTAPLLYVSPSQINFVVPNATAPGAATFYVTSGSTTQSFPAAVQSTAPTLFSLSGTGTGVADASALSIAADDPEVQTPVSIFQFNGAVCSEVPLNVTGRATIYVSFFGAGIRNFSALINVTAAINGLTLPVLYAEAAPGFPGLDPVNVALPSSLSGAGACNVSLTVDGQTSNIVTISIQ